MKQYQWLTNSIKKHNKKPLSLDRTIQEFHAIWKWNEKNTFVVMSKEEDPVEHLGFFMNGIDAQGWTWRRDNHLFVAFDYPN